jgi:DNA-directed RNA polymerase specialized sigma24 family protein
LWHDPSHRSTTPALDLLELQRSDPNGQLVSDHWTQLHRELKPRSISFLVHEGLPEADAEDVFSEAMVGMVQPRKSGTAVIQDLLIYEQTPALFLSILRRRLSNHIRHRHAEKRSARLTSSLDADETDAAEPAERTAFNAWAADAADPFSGMTFARLAEECASVLTRLQQRILTALYVEESATYMEVASSPWFMEAAQLKANSSAATRRRRLDHEHDSALDQLACSLGIERSESLQQVS